MSVANLKTIHQVGGMTQNRKCQPYGHFTGKEGGSLGSH